MEGVKFDRTPFPASFPRLEPQKFRHSILAEFCEIVRFHCQLRACQSNNTLEGIDALRVEEWQGTVSSLIRPFGRVRLLPRHATLAVPPPMNLVFTSVAIPLRATQRNHHNNLRLKAVRKLSRFSPPPHNMLWLRAPLLL